MAESAAHLVDRALPALPVRQWVLSLPFSLTFALARDHALLPSLLQVVMRARPRSFARAGSTGRGLAPRSAGR